MTEQRKFMTARSLSEEMPPGMAGLSRFLTRFRKTMGPSQRHSNFITRAGGWAARFAVVWDRPLYAGVLALLIYALIGLRWNSSWQATPTAYFNYLADAFLHGQLHLRLIPASIHDLVYYGGQYYLYWPPLPAILLMPFVALFGVQVSDVGFTVAIAALNVSLVALTLRHATRRGVIDLTAEQRGWLVVFLALGTVHVTLASFGQVWFTSQIVAFGGVTAAYLAALSLEGRRAFVWTGMALAAALLTRNHLILAGVWPFVYLVMRQRSVGWRRVSRNVLIGGLPIVAAIGLLGLYNWLRFGNPLDNGIAYHQMADLFVADYQQYGYFSWRYIPMNLFYQYLAYPLPYNSSTFMGGGLFWLSPLFVAAGVGLVRGQPRWSIGSLVLTIGLVATPILLLMGTGWAQFGPRYTLDFTFPLLLLTAIGLRRWPLRIVRLLVLISILQYAIGLMYWGSWLMTR